VRTVFEWFRSKVERSSTLRQESLAIPLPEERPIINVIYSFFLRPKMIGSSVVLKSGFCEEWKAEHKLLTNDHTAQLFDCPLEKCQRFLVKVIIEN
jgi:hypothetical protein